MKTVFCDLVAKPLLKWIKENPTYRTQKKFARALEITESDLTRILKGAKEPNGKTVDRIVQLGFSRKHFTDYYARQFEKPIPDNLDKEELIKIIFQMQVIANEWKIFYEKLADRHTKLIDSNLKDSDTINILTRKVDELEKKLHEMKAIAK